MSCKARSMIGCRKSPRKIGVLLLQLGTPAAPTAAALRSYLREFLSDTRVIELPRWKWYPILYGIVLLFRPKRSAALYQRIWGRDGSPLLQISNSQVTKLSQLLSQHGLDTKVALGMRYGEPALAQAVSELIGAGCRRIVAIPLYPQYAAATTASTYDLLFPALLKERWVPTLRVAEPFYENQLYISAVVEQIENKVKQLGWIPDKLILSYHGVPKRYVQNGDPYCCMCVETTQLIKQRIGNRYGEVLHTFQSRFGREEWLTPYTDETIKELASKGVKKILVACPGFTSDCLETLDEIGNEARHAFKELGGEELEVAACVNDSETFIDCLGNIVKTLCSDWSEQGNDAALHAINCPSAVNT